MFLRFNGPFDICITLVSFDNLKVSVGKSGYSSLYEQLNKCGWDEASSSTQNCEYPCSTFSTNLLAPRCMEQMLKAHMSAVVAIVLTFQAADLWDTPVIRFFCRCWVPWSIHPFEFRRCSALRSSLNKLFQPRPQLKILTLRLESHSQVLVSLPLQCPPMRSKQPKSWVPQWRPQLEQEIRR